MAVNKRPTRVGMRRALLAALVVVSSLTVIGVKAPPAAADSCSDCGESKTDLLFYSDNGASSIPAVDGQRRDTSGRSPATTGPGVELILPPSPTPMRRAAAPSTD